MSQYVFGVDIGGTTVKLGFFDVEGNLLDKWEIPTRTEGEGSHILPDIADSIQAKIAEKNIATEVIAGVGVGAPGPIDSDGVIHKAVNLGWGTFNVCETMEEILHMPVRAGNDVNVAAMGEMWKGGGQGYDNVVMVALGTGVGGGIIVDGKILTGATGAGGEVGHIHVENEETEVCGCGNKGCFEQYTSATGIARLANIRLAKDDMPSSLRGCAISAKSVFDAVKEGDALAIEVAEEFGECLGKACAMIACVVNPDVFVIGGGVSKAGPVLLDYIVKNYTPNVFHGSRDTKFALATLGNDAGIYGAAKLVLE